MGKGRPALGLVTDVVRRMARTDGTIGRVDSMLEVLGDAVDADVGLVVRADPTRTLVWVTGRGMAPGAGDALVRDLELTRASDPLLDRVSSGDVTPRSAEREFGAHAWARSLQRAGYRRLCGVDQVCTLPLVGGPYFVTAMFARRGPDFLEEHLRDLAAVQPVVAGVVALAGLRSLSELTSHFRLTPRETEVLVLLPAAIRARASAATSARRPAPWRPTSGVSTPSSGSATASPPCSRHTTSHSSPCGTASTTAAPGTADHAQQAPPVDRAGTPSGCERLPAARFAGRMTPRSVSGRHVSAPRVPRR